MSRPQTKLHGIVIKNGKAGDTFFTEKEPKYITALASFYNRKLTTKKLITIDPITLETSHIVKVNIAE